MAEGKADKIEGFVQDELPGFGKNWKDQKALGCEPIVNEGKVDTSQIPSGNTARVIRQVEDSDEEKPPGYYNGHLMYPSPKPDYCQVPEVIKGKTRLGRWRGRRAK